MKRYFVASIAIASTLANCLAAELFPDGKPIEYVSGTPLDPQATIGGYPIYMGEGWKLYGLKSGDSGSFGSASSIKMGAVALTQIEPDGTPFASMVVTTNLTNGSGEAYWSGAPCAGTHLVAVNKSAGRNDNCLTIDSSSYQSGDRNITHFVIRSTHSASGGRWLTLEINLNADMLGFKSSSPSDWAEVLVKADPVKKVFVEKLSKWAQAIQDSSQRALGYEKPQDAYAAVPSYRTLMDVPPDFADGSFTQSFVSAVVHQKNAPAFKAIAYTKYGPQKVKWGYTNKKDSQQDADARALEICNTGRPVTSEPCRLYDLNKLSLQK